MRAPRDEGAVAVEFGLVIPLLVVILLGIVDMGVVFNSKLAMTQAAREGVRVVALGGTSGEARTRVTEALSATSPQFAVGSVSATTCSGAGGGDARVVVSATVRTLLPLLGDIPISSGAVMRCGG